MSHYVSSSASPSELLVASRKRRDSRFTFIRDIVSYGFHDYLLNKPIHEAPRASLLSLLSLYMAAPSLMMEQTKQ
jgi:hypothetical protein